MPDDPAIPPRSRRSFLVRSAGIAAGAAALSIVPRPPLRAAPQAMQELIRNIVGEAPLQTGKVQLDVPPLVENGNAVSLTVSVDSPMTPRQKSDTALTPSSFHVGTDAYAPGRRDGAATAIERSFPDSRCGIGVERLETITSR